MSRFDELGRTVLVMFVSIGLFAFACATRVNGDDSTQHARVDFETEIRPLLIEHCLECHGGVKQSADVSLKTRQGALEIVDLDDPTASLLIDRVSSDDPDYVMPPPDHGDSLSPREVSLLQQWIAEGLPWQQPWAFETPRRPRPAEAATDPWCREVLDSYVLEQIITRRWQPSRPAPPEQWLRRVTLDLTGLPPTPGQSSDFIRRVKDRGDVAYRREVDRLLADPGFGHRWASVWLDQIRYADSRGLGLDGRRQIWKYRDWVIDSINHDLPFDQFTIKQIAGDLLPGASMEDLVATAANRLTQTNEEGGTDDEEFRVAAVLDRVSTVWQAWQGITFGCVQCHGHPYDPIDHHEFYEFAAFFNNTADTDLTEELPLLNVPLSRQDYERARRLDRQIEQIERRRWKFQSPMLGTKANWRTIDDLSAAADRQTGIQTERRDGHTEFFTTGTISRDTTITLTAKLPASLERLTGLRLTVLPSDPDRAMKDSEWGFVISHLSAAIRLPDGTETDVKLTAVIGDEPHPFKDPQESLNAKSKDGFAAYSRMHHPRRAAFVAERPVELADGSELIVRMKHSVHLLGAFSLLAKRGRLAVTDSELLIESVGGEQIDRWRYRLRQLRKQRQSIPSVPTPVLVERPEWLKRPTHVFDGGLFLTKGERVEADVPDALPTLPNTDQPDRLRLARWLTADDNPLTARVLVNRVWSRLFGSGLVVSEEDFGVSGQKPTHPRLLDHLAIKFQSDYRWNLKPLIREIVLSATYRQDAAVDGDQLAEDPANRWLARGPRVRMSAEMVRDASLSVAGLLTRNVGGPPVHPPLPDGVWKPFQASDKWRTASPDQDDRYRRSIYTYIKRSIPFPMFASFDAPSREFCAPRRLRSNTPVQALMLLNDQTFVEAADAVAQRMKSIDGDLLDQLRWGFTAVTSREPTDAELRTLSDLWNLSAHQVTAKAPSQGKDQGYNDVATVLLNLDEAMNK